MNQDDIGYNPEGIGSRIAAAADLLGDRKNAAAVCGVSTDSLQRYIRGEVKPPFQVIYLLSQASGISMTWIGSGVGPKSMSSLKEESPAEYRVGDRAEFVRVNHYQVEVSAGAGSVPLDPEPDGEIMFRRDWVKKKGYDPKKLATINARGDSMSPTLENGDLLLVDTSKKEIEDDGIYVIRLDGHIYVKRCQLMIDGSIKVISDNPAYSPQVVGKSEAADLVIVGKMVWSGGDRS